MPRKASTGPHHPLVFLLLHTPCYLYIFPLPFLLSSHKNLKESQLPLADAA
ncbi:hypothetical protein SLEP1_g42284 [Rubroshorea leprosula]|uniref:Uncharacterized protein n=1 Tax=Rubroshorea leprosula TaxID=152421 RepID=A0AAV5L9Z9_9ROSI|nr:hypothetical protein SLEP1_g42284 [Rubroshorea leprosula]